MNNHPKKILLVTTSDIVAGAEKNILDLLAHIDRTRYLPRLVVFKTDPHGALLTRVRELGVQAESIGISTKWHFFRLIRLWRILREFRPDILESFLFFDNIVCRLFGRLARVPVVISGQQNAETTRALFRAIADKATVGLADHIISNTQAGTQIYLDWGVPAERISIAHNGIDLALLAKKQSAHARREQRDCFGYVVPPGSLALVNVGFLTEQKGTRYLIEAAAILKRNNIPAQVFIIGDGPLRESLEALVRELDVADMVHIVGFKAESYQYIHLFDAFVLSSLWEGLPNVIIEAMASRVPVISTNVGGVAEVITDPRFGMLVPPKNSQALADAIMTLVKMPADKRKEIGDAAYAKVSSEFTVENMCAVYSSVYEKLLT